MLNLLEELGPGYNIFPAGIPENTDEYGAAIQARIEELLSDFNFMNEMPGSGDLKNPIIKEVLIRFFWEPPVGTESIGATYPRDFAKGMPHWAIANAGGTVSRSASIFKAIFTSRDNRWCTTSVAWL